jgi:hypothetical protein
LGMGIARKADLHRVDYALAQKVISSVSKRPSLLASVAFC